MAIPGHPPLAPRLLPSLDGGLEPWRSTSVDTIADSARTLALGKPQSGKPKARPEDVFPVMANAREHWTPQQQPPKAPPPSRGVFAWLFGGGERTATDAETEPLIEPGPSTWDAWKARVAPPPPKPSRCSCLCRRLPTLSYRQRLTGFAICFCLGLLLSLTSLTSFSAILVGNPMPFAFKYTFGNVLSMGASSFLVGPVKQCEDMFAPVRRVASLLYVASLGTTLLCIFYLHNKLLTTISMCLQLFAMVWYCFSYLPFGHTLLRRCVASVL